MKTVRPPQPSRHRNQTRSILRSTFTPLLAVLTAIISSSVLLQAGIHAPGEIEGLILFLDSKNGVVFGSSDKVSLWEDQAKHGPYPASQPAPRRQPFYSEGDSPTVRFTGEGGTTGTAGEWLQVEGAQAAVTNSVTMFVVYSIEDGDHSMALVDAGEVNSNRRGFSLYNHENNGLTVAFKDASYAGDSGIPPNNLKLYSTSLGRENTVLDQRVVAVARIEPDGTTMIRAGDSVQITPRSLSLTDISGYTNYLSIGSNCSHSWLLGGTISAVLLYNRALTDKEIDDLSDFLEKAYPAGTSP